MQIPVSGPCNVAVEPTHATLVSLLGGESALLPYFIAGQDITKVGDIGMPVMVLYKVEADGRISGRYPGCMLSGNMYQILGEDFIGVSKERVPFSEDSYFLTHMNVHPGR